LPVAVGLIAEFEKTVLGVVALGTGGASQVAAPVGACTVVVAGDRECGATAAWDEVHPEGGGVAWVCSGLPCVVPSLRDSHGNKTFPSTYVLG